MKDLYPNGRLVEVNQHRANLSPQKLRKLESIIANIPESWDHCISNSALQHTVVSPYHVINYNESDYFVNYLGTGRIYSILVSNIVKVPTGVIRWRNELVLTEEQLKTSLTFAKVCSSSIFDQVFQYKIVTQILPTRKYLHRYQIADSAWCSRCVEYSDTEHTDTVYYSVLQCSHL